MTINPWMKLVKLYFKVCSLAGRSFGVLPYIEAMMERKRERYSLLMNLENSPQELGLDPQQVKK